MWAENSGGGTERDEREWRDGRGAWEEKGRGNIAPTVTCEINSAYVQHTNI